MKILNKLHISDWSVDFTFSGEGESYNIFENVRKRFKMYISMVNGTLSSYQMY